MTDRETEKTQGDMTFEAKLQSVQDIIQRIEENTLSLEDSVKEFECGMKILNGLETELGELKRKITVLRTGRDGTPEEASLGGQHEEL